MHMESRKRARTPSDEDSSSKSNNYNVCDPCRARKVRCGRERPICANCDRLGQDCTWDGHGRRQSQSKAFKSVVDRIEDQLERLENSLPVVQNGLQRLERSQLRNGHRTSGVSSSLPCPALSEDSDIDISRCSPHGFRHHFVHCTDGREIYCGPTSLLSLIQATKGGVLDPMIRRGLMSKDEETAYTTRLEALKRQATAAVFATENNGIDPSMPPKAMLEAMFDTYFEEISLSCPLWTRDSFRSQMSVSRVNDIAWAIAANNMILMTLTARFARASSRQTLSPSQDVSIMETELTKPFANNARRAARVTDRLLAPTMPNLRALISLCIIAPMHLPAGELVRIFHQAQYIAQLLGLDWRRPPTGAEDFLTDTQWEERINLLRCLQDAAPLVHWMTGLDANRFLKHISDDASLKSSTKCMDTNLEDRVRASLMRINAAICEKLLIPSQPLMNSGRDCTCSTTLLHKLDCWYKEYHSDSFEQPGTREKKQQKLTQDLIVRYHFMRSVLLHAQSRDLNDVSAACNASEEFLRTLVVAWRSDPSLGVHLTLVLQMITYPVIDLVHLLQTIQEERHGSRGVGLIDLDLLRSVQSIAEGLAIVSHTDSHASEAMALVRLLIDLAISIHSEAMSVQPVTMLGPTPESTDDIFQSLPDFLKDASCNSSTTQSVDAYSLLDKPLPLPQSDVNFAQHIDANGVEQIFALELDKMQDTQIDSWWGLATT